MDRRDLADRIERFVRERFTVADGDGRLNRRTDLFEAGYIDSVGVVELLAFLEEEFGAEIPESDLMSDAFSTIDGIADAVARCVAGGGAPPSPEDARSAR